MEVNDQNRTNDDGGGEGGRNYRNKRHFFSPSLFQVVLHTLDQQGSALTVIFIDTEPHMKD